MQGIQYNHVQHNENRTVKYSTVQFNLFFDPPIHDFFSLGISVLSAILVKNPEIDEARMYYFLGMTVIT